MKQGKHGSQKTKQRLLSAVLAAVMVLSVFSTPLSAFAGGDDEAGEEPSTSVVLPDDDSTEPTEEPAAPAEGSEGDSAEGSESEAPAESPAESPAASEEATNAVTYRFWGNEQFWGYEADGLNPISYETLQAIYTDYEAGKEAYESFAAFVQAEYADSGFVLYTTVEGEAVMDADLPVVDDVTADDGTVYTFDKWVVVGENASEDFVPGVIYDAADGVVNVCAVWAGEDAEADEVAQPAGEPAKAAPAADVDTSTNMADYLTGMSVTIGDVTLKVDENGNVTEGTTAGAEKGSITSDKTSTNFQLWFSWSFGDGSDGTTIPTQDNYTLTYKIPSPSNKKVDFTGYGGNLTGDTDEGNGVIGSYSINGDVITFTFNGGNKSAAYRIEEERIGEVTMNGTLKGLDTDDDGNYKDKINFGGPLGEVTVNIKRDSSNDQVTVYKETVNNAYAGTTDSTKFYQDYRVTLESKGINKNAVWTDSMGSNIKLVDGSVKFYTDWNCTTEYTGKVTYQATSDGFQYTIDSMKNGDKIYAKYTVEMDVNSDLMAGTTSNKDYANTAKVTSNGKTNTSGPKYVQYNGVSLKKDSKYDETTGLITWTITLTTNGLDVSGYQLKDTLGFTLGDGEKAEITSVETTTNKVTTDANWSGLTWDALTGGFALPKGSTADKYVITYTTPFKLDEYKEQNPQNTIDFLDETGTTTIKSDSEKAEVGETWEWVDKECLTLDPRAEEVEWKITVHVKGNTTKLDVTDTLPKGMSYVVNSATVDGTATEPTVGDKSGKVTLTFSLGAQSVNGTKDIEIKLKSKIDEAPLSELTDKDHRSKSYKNEVKVDVGGLGGDTSASATYTYLSPMYKEAAWNQSAYQLDWKLTVTDIEDDVTTATITDTLPANTKLMADSIAVKDKNGYAFTKDTDYTVTYVEGNSTAGGTLTIVLNESALNLARCKRTKANDTNVHDKLEITYSLEFIDLNKAINGTAQELNWYHYKNSAVISFGGTEFTPQIGDNYKTPDAMKNEALSKTHTYNESTAPYVNYTITINQYKADLNREGNTLTLTDTMGTALDFVSIDSVTIDGKDAVEDTDYTFEQDASDARKFTITVPDEAKVVVKYTAMVNIADDDGATFEGEEAYNTANLSGTVEGGYQNVDKIDGQVQSASGSASSRKGMRSFYIEKVSGSDETIHLEGAKFACYEVYDNTGDNATAAVITDNGSNVALTVDKDASEDGLRTTNSTGLAKYQKVLKRNVVYKFVETEAPEGYELDTTPIYVFYQLTGETTYPTQVTFGETTYDINVFGDKVGNSQMKVTNEPTPDNKLIITKTISGEVTKAEAEGALKFNVKSTKAKFDQTYDLSSFEYNEATKTWSKTIGIDAVDDIVVTEQVTDIDGKTLTSVTYSVDGGEAKNITANKATDAVTVTENGTTTVAYANTYSSAGSIVITKTIEGDVTEDEAKNGALKFEVKKNGEEFKTLTLSDFNHKEDTKVWTYTLTVTGNDYYTVTETATDINGYTHTGTTYKVDGQTATEDEQLTAAVGTTKNVAYTNSYVKNGTLKIVKTFNGEVTKEEAAGALSFTVTSNEKDDNGNPKFSHTYKLSDTDGSVNYDSTNNKWTITINDVDPTLTYTVTEQTETITGKVLTKTTSVALPLNASGVPTSTSNSGDATISNVKVNAGLTTEVDYTNSYTNKGTLAITKTITGPVSKEEAEGALKFAVTEKDANGNTVENSTVTGVYTLKQFNYDKQTGVWTKTFAGVDPDHTFTVVETSYDVTGCALTSTTYTVDNAAAVTGKSVNVSVTAGNTKTVAFANNYEKLGKIVITKTIEGNVTQEEAEGALKFSLIKNSTTPSTLTLKKDFTYNEETGVWTHTIENVRPTDTYAVSESVTTIDGYQYNSTTYSLNGTEGTGTGVLNVKAAYNTTTNLDFTNSYTKYGNLVITKTIKGDLTDAEKAGGLKFVVTETTADGTTKISNYTINPHFTETTAADGTKVYTKTITGVDPTSTFTVEETATTIDGYTLTSAKYTIDGTTTTGTKTGNITVPAGETKTVAYENEYKLYGSIVITKTIKGDVTKDEAEGALKFSIIKNMTTPSEVSLKDFTYDAATKTWTYTIPNVRPTDTFVISESVTTIDGYQYNGTTYTMSANGGALSAETTGTGVQNVKAAAGTTTTVNFENDYTEYGDLVITKTIEGAVTKDEAEGALEFTVTEKDDEGKTVDTKVYTLKDFTKGNDGTYTKTIERVNPNSTFTVEETVTGIDGNKYKSTYYILTVNGESSESTSGKAVNAGKVAAGTTTKVAYKNDYVQLGTLKIQKTIEGNITKEEYEGALKFTVTTADGTKIGTYTLKDGFTYEGNGVWTKTFTNVDPETTYTVEETVEDVKGWKLTKTTSTEFPLNAQGVPTSAKNTGDTKIVGVKVNSGLTTLVDYKNTYVNYGDLVITKTVEGPVTKEEAEGALTFTVTSEENEFNETYSLKDFDTYTVNEDGTQTWTKTISAAPGEDYVVTENIVDIDGTRLASTTYAVRSKTYEEDVVDTKGDVGTSVDAVKVEPAGRTDVVYKNDYVGTGTLVITKTIEGPVTKEEAEGALRFVVTSKSTGETNVYTLKSDFEYKDGVWTKELTEDVGGYTVTEQIQSISGVTLAAVTYDVGGTFGVGAKSEADVLQRKTTTVAYTNDYQLIPVEDDDPFNYDDFTEDPTTPGTTEEPEIPVIPAQPETPAPEAPVETPVEETPVEIPAESETVVAPAEQPAKGGLIQTGQLWAPVFGMLGAGAALVATGAALQHRGKNKDEDDK